MNSDRMAGKWLQLKGNIRRQWGKLTDDDLDVIAGSRDKLAGMIRERYGVAKEEAERQIDVWFQAVQAATEDMRRHVA